jgi:hypothetical protein
MIADHVLPNTHLDPLPGILAEVLPDLVIKAFYFSSVATVFVFVSILLTGIYP